MKRYDCFFVALLGVTALTPQMALAQDFTSETDESQPASTGLGDIIVTATRHEAKLQTVPVAVTAVTGDALASADVSTVRSLTQVVPGFIGSRNMGVFQPVVRGVGSTGISVGDEPNIATYVDGVYQPESAANWIDLVEVERVEVLRGPQGTTFGRNATGGLINVITPDPSFDFRGKASLRLGRMRRDAGDYDARLYFTGPMGDKVAADFAALFRKNDGYIDDLVRGGTLGNQRVIDLRSKLLFKPTDNFKVVLTGEYFNQESTTNSPQPLDGNTAGNNWPGVIVPTRAWQASLTEVPLLNLTRWSAALHTRLDLGSVLLETTTGFLNLRWRQTTDGDASNIKLSNFPAVFESESGSQEIKLSSANPGRFQWLVGGYFYQFGGGAPVLEPWTTTNPALPLAGPSLTPKLDGRSFAVFAEGTYEVQPNLFITLGGRYTTETRWFSQSNNGVLLVNDVSKTFKKFNYKVGIRYEVTDKTNVYATYSTAFKSGVYNMAGISGTPVNPENIKAAEFGIKSDPLEWLRTNLAAYYYDYKGLQLQSKAPTGPGYILQNAANAEIYGGEFETIINPVRDLRLRAAVAYTHARYKDFPNAQGFTPIVNGNGNYAGNVAAPYDASGKVMTRAPEWSGNVGFDWSHDVGNGRVTLAGNLLWSSRVYYDFANIFSQRPYTLSNLSINWQPGSEAFKVGLWVTNLTNEKVLQTVRPGTLGTDGFYEQPRKIGITIETKI
ncbi:TonB-dependent receptor (plasmid) [Sphingobium sp. SJ10-10]|jgi:iron complex outermembrane recepter protein|uniref:TonB-dependent receptor n=1 Tax=Sphingobium chungbukense TaxID=56193 RepID=A0A0M3AMN1_9SPHN|nr:MULTISPECIES: TonB-dependent receptor [Sphingobium]ETI64631.1 TonB-denpendent receptor [Sphingobium sp. C100]KKW89789.1 TonB-dependent receptor [Sphingobium chungbukense]